MKSEVDSEENELKKKARREKLLDPNRLKILSENMSDFPEELKPEEEELVNVDEKNISRVKELFETVAQSQDFQKRNILYWIRRVSIVVILFGFSLMICLNPQNFYSIDKLFIKLLMFSFFSSILSVVVCSSAFGMKFSMYDMIGTNWVAKLLISLLNVPQYIVIIIDFGITFYISLSILVFSLTAITAYQTYIQDYINIFNISVIISIVVGIISFIVMIKRNRDTSNRIEVIVEYLYYELSLIPVSVEVKKMLKKDKDSVNCKTDKRAVEYEELLERVCKLTEYFGDDIKQFIKNNKTAIYNKLENDERFKVFEKDVEKKGEGEKKVGSFTMIWAKPAKL